MWRSPVKWALPFLAGFEWWIVNELRAPEFALWSQIGPAFLYSILIVGPVAAAFAGLRAWAERRPSLDDLMRTSARDPMARHWVACFGDVSWVAVAYLVTLGVVIAVVAPQASWGGPDVGMLIAGFVALWTCGLIGWMVGWLVPSRITGPIVGIALYVLMGLALSFDVAWAALSPSGAPEALRPHEQIRPGVGWWQTVWFTGVALTAISIAAWLAHSRRSRWLLIVGGPLAVVAAIALAPGVGRSQIADPTLVCEAGEIEVCYHPAYESGMEAAGRAVMQTLLPLVDARLLPARAEMEFGSTDRGDDLESVPFPALGDPDEVSATLANWALSPGECDADTQEPAWRAQSAIRNWLVIRAGYNPGAGITISDGSGTRTARLEDVVDEETMRLIEEFSELTYDQQVRWLAEHFDDLLRCQTDLERLP